MVGFGCCIGLIGFTSIICIILSLCGCGPRDLYVLTEEGRYQFRHEYMETGFLQEIGNILCFLLVLFVIGLIYMGLVMHANDIDMISIPQFLLYTLSGFPALYWALMVFTLFIFICLMIILIPFFLFGLGECIFLQRPHRSVLHVVRNKIFPHSFHDVDSSTSDRSKPSLTSN